MTKERPIIFNGDMVRAILDGRKTQTRRLVPEWQIPKETKGDDVPGLEWMSVAQRHRRYGFGVFGKTEDECMQNYNPNYSSCCPYGSKGQRLWVRETWGIGNGPGIYVCNNAPHVTVGGFKHHVFYKADCSNKTAFGMYGESKWKPSIHMFRTASRITLEIENVRVERLQDISEEDAVAEGVETIPAPVFKAWKNYLEDDQFCFKARSSFITLWSLVHNWDSWKSNPWVWVIDFSWIKQ